MKKKVKIKDSPAMIVGRVLIGFVFACAIAVVVALLVPGENEIVNFSTEQEVRESVAYDNSRSALLYILNDDTITEIESISYIYVGERTMDCVEVKYRSGDEVKTRYFGEKRVLGSPTTTIKYEFKEYTTKEYRGTAFADWILVVDPTVSREAGKHTYDEFSTKVILDDARSIKNGNYIM